MTRPRTASGLPSNVAILLFAGALVLTYAVYWPGLGGPLLLDDLPQLGAIMDASDRGADYLASNYLISSSGPIGRPVSMLSFIGDAALFGDETWWWKHTNLLLHLVSGVLVFWLTFLLVRAVRPEAENDRYFALVVAALWLLHPLNVSTVLYTVQRMTELSTLFVLAALICYVQGRLLQARHSRRGWFLIAAGFGVFFPLGVLSKENALLFPLYVTLVEWIVLRFRTAGRDATGVRRLHAALLLGYAAAAVLVLVNFQAIVLDAYLNRDYTLIERTLTQFRVVTVYVGQTLLPLQGNMHFFRDALPWSTGLFTPLTTAFSLAFLIALAGVALTLRKRFPLFAFGVLLFFASHAMESTLLGLELMFEHRNYLGSFALLLAVSDAFVNLVQNARARAALAIACVAVLCIGTVQRSVTWSSFERLYTHEAQKHPNSARVNEALATAAVAAGNFPAAREYLKKSGSTLDKAMQSALFDCLEFGRIDDAAIERIVNAEHDFVAAVVSATAGRIVNEVVFNDCGAQAGVLIDLLDHLLTLRVRSDVDRQRLLFARALAAEWGGDIEESLKSYRLAQTANPKDALATYQAADLLARHGRYEAAIGELGRAVELDAATNRDRSDLAVLIYTGIGQLYVDTGRPGEALQLFDRARAALPNRAVFHIKSVELLLTMQRWDAADALLAELEARDYVDWDEQAEALETLAAELEEKRQGAARLDGDG